MSGNEISKWLGGKIYDEDILRYRFPTKEEIAARRGETPLLPREEQEPPHPPWFLTLLLHKPNAQCLEHKLKDSNYDPDNGRG